jgi:hypothetical protein
VIDWVEGWSKQESRHWFELGDFFGEFVLLACF